MKEVSRRALLKTVSLKGVFLKHREETLREVNNGPQYIKLQTLKVGDA